MNKMSKKILALLLTLVMTASLCPMSVFATGSTETSDSVTTEVTVIDTATETGEDETTVTAETEDITAAATETGEDETTVTAETEDTTAAATVSETTTEDDSEDDSGTTTEQGDIGEKLNGDYAYLSDVAMVEDSTTTSGYAMRTGTSPWDDDDTAGNDSTDLNNSLRTYDVATYTVTFTSRVRDDAPYKFYYQGNLYFEFILQGDSSEVQFETGSMGWLDAKNATYTVSQETIDGEVCQVLRGYYSWQPASGNDHAIGESTQELTLAIRALAMSNGDTIQPTFTFWLEGNEVGVDYSKWGTEDYTDGVVTGNNATCSTHSETEYQTITAPKITVSAKASYNIKIVSASATNSQTVGTFDFSTGNNLALDSDAGSVYGRLGAYGIIIQIVGKDATSGLRGVELPKSGEDITFTLELSSSYTTSSSKTTTDITDTYTPLVWSFDENALGSTQQDGRTIPVSVTAANGAPLNTYTASQYYNSCYDGGDWSIIDNGDGTYSVTVKNCVINMNQLPFANYGGNKLSTTYYDPSSITNYWDVQYACISAGEMWVVQPFYADTDNDGESDDYIVDEYGDGTFTVTLKDTDLSMTTESGTKQTDTKGTNDAQAVTTDDSQAQSMAITKTGSISESIAYIKYNYTEYNDALTDGCFQTGQDWILQGNQLGIEDYISHDSAEGGNTGVAYDELIKFDDAFFNIEKVKSGGTVYFAAKPDKTGWDHTDGNGNTLSPDEDGYDTEMKNATTDDLVYFTSLSDLEDAGYTCVGVLVEYRALRSEQMNHLHTYLLGQTTSTAEVDQVYMVSHYARAWNRSDLVNAINAAGGSMTLAELLAMSSSEVNSLIDQYIPSRKDYTLDKQLAAANSTNAKLYTNYPDCFWINGGSDGTSSNSASIRNYTKPTYVNGTYTTGGFEGVLWGDSCLLVGYTTGVTLNVAQTTTGGAEKAAYDMDTSQRIVDYALQAFVNRNAGDSTTEGATQTTNITLTVTLPAGLTYLEGSSYIGGTYTTNGEGVQGTVTGGTLLEENNTVTVYDEGENALYTVTLSLESNEDGTTTLTYTLTGVTLTSDLTQYLDTIHFSCQIGTEGNEETDVSNGDSLTVSATVESTEDCNRDLKTANGNYSECGILISKNSASALSKFADQSVVEVGGTMGFTLNVANNSTNKTTVRAVEGLPYSTDGVSSFTGDLVVTEFRVYSSATADKDGNYSYTAEEFAERYGDIKFYYTTNTDYRGKYSEDLQNENFTDTDNWTELTISSDGTAELPEGDFKPVAIVAVGTLPASTTLRMHISITLPDGQGGDYVVNKLSNYNTASLTSSARCRIISRALEGLAWYDANADGIQNGGTGLKGDETVVNGVKVELLKLKDGGDATNEEDYEFVASTTTGHQYDVQTKETTDYTTGYYYFTSLSAGTYAVRFTEGTYSFTDMNATLVDQGSDDTIDSDAVATYDADNGSLTQTLITGITMPDVSTLTYGSYVDRHHDSGFYCAKTYEAEDIVIDFGLPVDHSITGWNDSVSSLTGSATYGDVTVSGSTAKGWTVTYTPTKVLTGIDTVTLTDGNSNEYTFKVYPATTVYYEEGFATYGTGWGVTSGGSWSGQLSVNYSTKQETEIANTANNSYNNYNYDEAYANDTGASNGTTAVDTTKGDSLTFTFTGTGVDIFATGTSATGTVNIQIKNSSGSAVKMLTVDTSDIGSYNSGDVAYNTPIASVSNLTYGSYTVVIYVSTPDSGFVFDGFRVYDTCKNDDSADAVYTADLEDSPVYYELRNNVLAGLNVSTGSEKTIYASDIAKTTLAQVYATGTDNTSGAVVYYANSEGNSLLQKDTDVQDLLDDGPKNELYLYPGMTVIFTINTSREVQIGLRSVTGAEVNYRINNTSSSISSSVDMFYTLQSSGTSGSVTYTITVPETSTGILSITDIKACDCASESVFGELTEANLTAALVSLGYAVEEVTADATLTVNLVDYTGSVLASTELTENGTEGESATFSVSDILAAVNGVLPDGYALVDEDSIADQTVTYGESGSVNIQIGKVATLTVTYQKYSGLLKKTTVGTATLTKVQTSSTSKATFSASEIKSAVPSGYKVLLATSSSVNYGSAGTKTVTVY